MRHPAIALATLGLGTSVFAQQAIDISNPSDGTESGYVRISDDPSLEPQQFTIDLTFVAQGPGFGNTNNLDGGTLFAKPIEAAGGVFVLSWATQWSAQTGKVNFVLSNDGNEVGLKVFSHCSVPLGKQARVTASFDGAAVRLYINGELSAQEETDFSSVYYGADDVLIGAGNYCCGFLRRFDGVIDDVSFWGRALSDEEVANLDGGALAGDEADLIGLWKFDDGTLNDASANANNGTAVGAVTSVDGVPSTDPCTVDLNGSGSIGSGDLNIVLGAFGANDCGDIDGDGDTDSVDLNLCLADFGQDCE